MNLKLIDYPTKISVSQYDALKTKLVNALIAENSVLSVYQMGSVKDPGISDLDIICIFKNNSNCNLSLRTDLSNEEKKMLTHGIFGLEEKDLNPIISYNLLSNLQHLGGKDLNLKNNDTNSSKEIKDQIALEYMLKMYITLDTQITLGIVKLRSFLLLGKAIRFDLELLGISEGKLSDCVNKVLHYRQIWYDNRPQDKDIIALIQNFYKALEEELIALLNQKEFYLPSNSISLPGNFKILKAEFFKKNHKGLVLPSRLQFLGKKYINLQYRLNEFTYQIPYKIPDKGTYLEDRFNFSKQMVLKNRSSYPDFLAVTSSLSIY